MHLSNSNITSARAWISASSILLSPRLRARTPQEKQICYYNWENLLKFIHVSTVFEICHKDLNPNITIATTVASKTTLNQKAKGSLQCIGASRKCWEGSVISWWFARLERSGQGTPAWTNASPPLFNIRLWHPLASGIKTGQKSRVF